MYTHGRNNAYQICSKLHKRLRDWIELVTIQHTQSQHTQSNKPVHINCFNMSLLMPNPRCYMIYCNSEKVNFYMVQICHGPSNTVKLLLYRITTRMPIARYCVIVSHACQIVYKVKPKSVYCTLAKEGPLRNVGSPLHFRHNFLQKSSVYSNMRLCVAALENAAKMAFLWGLNFE